MEGQDRDAGAPSGSDGDTSVHVGRRQLLQTGVSVGASAGLVWGFGTDYVSAGRTETITYAMARPEPGSNTLEPRTREVPVEWYRSLRLAFEVQAEILEAGLSPLIGSFVVPGTLAEPAASIRVDATDERVSATLEDVAEGVAVDVNLVDAIPPKPGPETALADAYRVSDLARGRVPGGVVCTAGGSFGTLAPALFDAESGSRFFATSNHVFGASGTKETEHRGEPLSVRYRDDGRHVGDVRRGYPLADVVRVAPVEGFRPASAIERATPSRVIGQYTKLGLADLVARGEPLTKVGALSGRTTGRIRGIDGVTCYSGKACKLGQVKWGDARSILDGDSGSVTFHEDPERPGECVLVGSINNARSWWSGADFVWGTAAHHLLDAFGCHF
ncbi:hypothetical protein [Halorarum halobium]|uniref:hypothetical protein n=1 Tax=Halorarum halobium TaxID=3075121 RepID=UPI0028ACC35A|nr:hypothetical protein [Halobaculum sp. XH14]